ncbi:MAG: PmoA family protein [Clostridia bacterium]|nr:PmoA family protein [Clostridia bacterium]
MNTMFEYTASRKLTEEPVFLASEANLSGITSVSANGKVFPAAPVDGGLLVILSADAGETLALTAGTEECGGCTAALEADAHKIHLTAGGFAFADYVFDPAFPKPHLGPITDNSGNSFTRCDRMHKEHPHQRSIIIAIGDVNGVDCWNEPAETCGYVRNEEIYDVVSTSAYAAFSARNRWTDHDGKPLMTENTRFVVYNQTESCRMLDLRITFTADSGDVVFGPTKEAGPLGIRLRDELRADIGKGVLCNSRGGVGEGECWGKDAEWCDYYGVLDGIGDMGVTVYDHPSNERYPTAWHIRAYGLFAANNFHFKGGYTLKSGESITYTYRILFRRQPMTADELSARYESYTAEPVCL